MNRRRFLAVAASSAGLVPGCTETIGSAPARTGSPDGSTRTGTRTPASIGTPSSTPGREHPDTLFVDAAAGSSGGTGTRDRPLASIQRAIDRAMPGETVHVNPGTYPEHLETRRDGEAGAPITITGPPDAVVRHRHVEGEKDWGVVIGHSHVHLTGLTLDGLRNPDAPNDRRSYGRLNVACLPGGVDRALRPEEFEAGTYLTDVKIMPHAVGNTRGPAVKPLLTNDLEIGEFRVAGPTGLDFLEFGQYGHAGEVIYLGVPSTSGYDLTGGRVDRSHGIHIHHVDASAGYRHLGGFPDVKIGIHDVVVEYCTSANARLPSDNEHGSVAHIGGRDVTFRWNRIESAADRAIDVGNYRDAPHPDAPDAGTDNAIYGNELVDLGGRAINYTRETSEDAQRVVCGNVVEGASDGTPDRACSGSVPTGTGVGHLGGETPWA